MRTYTHSDLMSPDDITERETFGKFELAEPIGHGGMATVHRAYHNSLGGFKREVVIKRILPELASDRQFLRMFVQEAKLSALLDHPNIVQVHDFGVVDGVYFLAMEYIEGVTLLELRKHLRRCGRPFPEEVAAFIAHQVCQGLAYAHGLTGAGQPLGLVHRDISPSNIMISVHGAVKLLDFGIAKAVDAIEEGQTRTGSLKGKWSYMSPEQVMGGSIDRRSDLFSVGVVLWEILTGKRLFKDKTAYLTLANVARAEVPPLSSLRPDLSPLVAAICEQALARDPAERYPDAVALSDELEAFLAIAPCSNSGLAALVEPLLFERQGSAEGNTSSTAIEIPPPAIAPEQPPVRHSTPAPARKRSTDTHSAVAGERSAGAAPRRGVILTALTGAAVLAATLAVIVAFATSGEDRATAVGAPSPFERVLIAAEKRRPERLDAGAAVEADAGALDASADAAAPPVIERVIVTPEPRPVHRRTHRRLLNLKAGELADPYNE